jgi:hypothetical protein
MRELAKLDGPGERDFEREHHLDLDHVKRPPHHHHKHLLVDDHPSALDADRQPVRLRRAHRLLCGNPGGEWTSGTHARAAQ